MTSLFLSKFSFLNALDIFIVEFNRQIIWNWFNPYRSQQFTHLDSYLTNSCCWLAKGGDDPRTTGEMRMKWGGGGA